MNKILIASTLNYFKENLDIINQLFLIYYQDFAANSYKNKVYPEAMLTENKDQEYIQVLNKSSSKN